ncbi:hypothetical protein QBC46DRAFT_67109 [Diplogelasinospora grovesii]|uniref:Uncharacterized protein n=1 Tax=Diplogelasinospora grovesii TaxID=303347 RepID=A0AAN6NBL6_9PEZI|nr:hypothetical protein QBC46DRAFT_67109 [Diplogelasinospora grovesii]
MSNFMSNQTLGWICPPMLVPGSLVLRGMMMCLGEERHGAGTPSRAPMCRRWMHCTINKHTCRMGIDRHRLTSTNLVTDRYSILHPRAVQPLSAGYTKVVSSSSILPYLIPRELMVDIAPPTVINLTNKSDMMFAHSRVQQQQSHGTQNNLRSTEVTGSSEFGRRRSQTGPVHKAVQVRTLLLLTVFWWTLINQHMAPERDSLACWPKEPIPIRPCFRLHPLFFGHKGTPPGRKRWPWS